MPSREKRKLGMQSFRKSGKFTSWFARSLENLEQKQTALSRNEESIKVIRRSFFFKCRYIYRPVQILLGVLLLLLALLIFVSLLLSDINKSIHFVSFKQVFAQGNKTLPDPIDIVLTWTGKVREDFFENVDIICCHIRFWSITPWIIFCWRCY